MAMYERRSSMESLRQWRAQSPTGSERQKLSFNPVNEWTPTTENTVSAFEVSRFHRIAQVSIAVVYCLAAAGIVFGYAALKPVLVAEGVYADLCTPQERVDGVWVCYQQELRLNLMFTVAAVSTNVCALPVGTILDRFGPRVASMIGVIFLTVGALLLAFAADVAPALDLYLPGYLFLALGGPFVFIPSFQLSNTFPQSSGLILALLTGAFDTSSAVFLAYRLLYQNSNRTFTPKKFFLLYLFVPALITVAQIFVMPAASYKTVGELVQQAEDCRQESAVFDADDNGESDTAFEVDSHEGRRMRHGQNGNGDSGVLTPGAPRARSDSIATEIDALLGSHTGVKQAEQEDKKAARSGVWGVLHGKTAKEQIGSLWFLLITLFTIVQMTRINYFVATIRTQYAQLLGSESAAVRVNNVFDIALPLGGVVAVPFIGFLLDHTSTLFVLTLLVTLATVIGVLGVIPHSFPAAYANIALFVVYRPLYYTAVSDYSAKVFGFQTFGKVYGLIICLAGLFNFAQAGLDAATHQVFQEDPLPVNVILLSIALLVGVALVTFVWRRSRSLHRDILEREADDAAEVLIPGADRERVQLPHGHETYGTA